MKNEEFSMMVQTECCNCYVEVKVTPEQFLLEKEFNIILIRLYANWELLLTQEDFKKKLLIKTNTLYLYGTGNEQKLEVEMLR